MVTVFVACTGFALSGPLFQVQAVYAQEPPAFDPANDLDEVPVPTAPPSARAGGGLYQENCAPCHGAAGMGDGPTAPELPTPPTAFADPDAIWETTPAELFYVTKFGRIENLMPPWGNQLSDSQIWQAVAYAWSLHTTERALSQAAEQYEASCAGCHGPEGAGDGPDAGDSMPDFTDLSYVIAHSQVDWMDGWTAAHPEEGAAWSESEQRDVLEYVRSFSYVTPWEPAYRPGAGEIQGQVVQGTPGGPDVENTVVRLEAYANFEPVASFTTTVQADGSFEFVDLALDETIVYLASASSDNVRYSSPILTLTEDEPVASTQIVVYEPTEDASGIQIDRAHWIIDFQPGAALVGQIINFGSTSDRAYIGQRVDGVEAPITVGMAVPPGAQDIVFENGVLGGRFQQIDNVIYDTTPVVPGTATKQIILRYTIPYEDNSVVIGQEFLYPAGQMDLLIADLPSLQASVADLTSAGIQTFQDRAYRIWQGETLQPGVIEVELLGLLRSDEVDPRASGEMATAGGTAATTAMVTVLRPWMAWTTGGLIVVLMAGVFGWAWSQGRVKTVDDAEALVLQRNELLRQIAHLDDRYAMGEVQADAWQHHRAQLKAKLLEIAGRLVDLDSETV